MFTRLQKLDRKIAIIGTLVTVISIIVTLAFTPAFSEQDQSAGEQSIMINNEKVEVDQIGNNNTQINDYSQHQTQHIYGDNVQGDKVQGDKVYGNKIVNQ